MTAEEVIDGGHRLARLRLRVRLVRCRGDRAAARACAPPPPVAPAPPPVAGLWEPNTDRPGTDYRRFELGAPRPEVCRDACWGEPQCRAFTYARPGVQGPHARSATSRMRFRRRAPPIAVCRA